MSNLWVLRWLRKKPVTATWILALGVSEQSVDLVLIIRKGRCWTLNKPSLRMQRVLRWRSVHAQVPRSQTELPGAPSWEQRHPWMHWVWRCAIPVCTLLNIMVFGHMRTHLAMSSRSTCPSIVVPPRRVKENENSSALGPWSRIVLNCLWFLNNGCRVLCNLQIDWNFDVNQTEASKYGECAIEYSFVQIHWLYPNCHIRVHELLLLQDMNCFRFHHWHLRPFGSA